MWQKSLQGRVNMLQLYMSKVVNVGNWQQV